MQVELKPIQKLEPRLRRLLPADVYVATWLNADRNTLTKTLDHLRKMHRTLFDYVPRHVTEIMTEPGRIQHEWQEGSLMFTDLAGFTALLEAYSVYGTAGAGDVLKILNDYFSTTIEIISKSGGHLLEFTGDAVLVHFAGNDYQNDTEQAVNAGLRMQRAMSKFQDIQTPHGKLSLEMRIGVHRGRFIMAQIGTPRRMEQVLLGSPVRLSKIAEGAGREGRVNLTPEAYEFVKDKFETEPGDEGHIIVIDNFTEEQLGDYELTAFSARRLPGSLLLDRSEEGLTEAIEEMVNKIEPLACYIPLPVMDFLVENVSRDGIPPTFPELTVMFINLIGISENIEAIEEENIGDIITKFSELFALINASIESRGGVLKHVTYHLSGADILIYFGLPNAHANDSSRAVAAANEIRHIVEEMPSPYGEDETMAVKIGISHGSVFAAEIGEQRGRREWNILGDTVNIAARLMGVAKPNQILMNESVYHEVWREYDCEMLPRVTLKGKTRRLPIFTLLGEIEDEIEA